MNRLAVFVEGFTELVFAKKLIEEIAGKNKVQVELRRIRGGSSCRRSFELIASQPATGQSYYVLIVDCGNDELVKSRILEEHENLTQRGYSRIVGIRDVRPKYSYADIAKLAAGLPTYIKTSLAPVDFILAIMEVEAWFLAEATHFPKIDPVITVAAIKSTLGFDPENDDMEQRVAPADDLHDCYQIARKSYRKGQSQTTVEALDYARIYMEFPKKFKYMDRLVQIIDEFLA